MISEQDKSLIREFLANKKMADAVKRALCAGIEKSESGQNWIFSIDRKLDDAEYGRTVKVVAQALALLEATFNDLKRAVSSNPQRDVVNEAR